ncbi:UDP-D-xylose:L-fucose alpha-1,3-D-xylosyltransferase MGP4-like [Oryza glaberrima]|nr:UDP-D-xylose:L-fucose alpha-1,3-D-xylosyltransferase MGP4-like [Oryza glaberrima]
MSLHQRPHQKPPATDSLPASAAAAAAAPSRPLPLLTLPYLFSLLALLLLLALLFPWGPPRHSSAPASPWRGYTLQEAAAFAARAGNGTIVLAAVSGPYLPFLSNWLITVRRAGRADQVLVVAEDYDTLERINAAWPGHAVLVPPAPDAQVAHKFGSQGFFNFTSRRPRHLLQILELGYSVMYNDVDMVWLADPFPYIVGDHDVYFMDDMTPVKPLDHSHELPPPGKKGRTYICSCMIFLRPTEGAKLLLRKWIEELKEQPWSKKQKANDQPAFNWALNKTAGQVDVYLLPQSAFPTGGLYFKNKTWVKETKGKHVIIHNNYITGFEKKIKRFRDHGLWLVDEHSDESPLGRICISYCLWQGSMGQAAAKAKQGGDQAENKTGKDEKVAKPKDAKDLIDFMEKNYDLIKDVTKFEDFYHAFYELIEKFCEERGQLQYRIPEKAELQKQYERVNKSPQKGQNLSRKQFMELAGQVIKVNSFTFGKATMDVLVVLFGAPVCALLAKRVVPGLKSFSDDVVIPVATSGAVVYLAKTNKL